MKRARAAAGETTPAPTTRRARTATPGGESFTAGTKVLLASGAAVAISHLKPGEKVLATNTKTGKTSAETVTAVLVHHDTDLYDLTVRTGTAPPSSTPPATTCSGILIFTTAGFRQITSNRACISRPRTASRPW